jgi:hypothetical protein
MPRKAKSNGATLDFEAQLRAAADKLRGHMASSEYKHVVLGPIFLKYIYDSFEEVHSPSESSFPQMLLIMKNPSPGSHPKERNCLFLFFSGIKQLSARSAEPKSSNTVVAGRWGGL